MVVVLELLLGICVDETNDNVSIQVCARDANYE